MDALVLDGRYLIGERLGEGGMGAVWEAVDQRLERQVAVKVMSGVSVRRDPRAKDRFDREAKLLAGLASPYVVTVHDAGEAVVENNRLLYLVMERLHGRSLGQVIAEGLPTLDEVAHWAEQICRALAVAHEAGVVHRDLKPANVMVCADGLVRVLDFGIAAVLTENPDQARLTSTGLIVGTPAYMAPEQIESGSYDSRSDLYALGCMLYELVVGRPPFEGDALYALMRQHMTAVPELPSAQRPGLPDEWDALIMHLLAKEPDARPATAEDVGEGVRQLPRPEVPDTPDFTPRADIDEAEPPGYEPTRVDPRMAMAAPAAAPAAPPAVPASGGYGGESGESAPEPWDSADGEVVGEFGPPDASGPSHPGFGGTPYPPHGAPPMPGQYVPEDGTPSQPAAEPPVPTEPGMPPVPAAPPVPTVGPWLADGQQAGPYPGAERLSVTLSWEVAEDAAEEPEVDGSALALDADGRVLSDRHFVFYNNLELPGDDEGGSLHLEEDHAAGEQRFHVEPDRFEEEAERVVFVLSLHEAEERGHDFSLLSEVAIRLDDAGEAGTELCRYRPAAEVLEEGRGLTLGELVRTPDGWAFQAGAVPYAEGLVEIAQAYGVNV